MNNEHVWNNPSIDTEDFEDRRRGAGSKNSRRANWSAVRIFTRIEEVPDDGVEKGTDGRRGKGGKWAALVTRGE